MSLTPSHPLSPPLTPSHPLSLTPSHPLSPPLTPSHPLSPPLTPSHPLSPPLTPSHPLSPPLTFYLPSHLLLSHPPYQVVVNAQNEVTQKEAALQESRKRADLLDGWLREKEAELEHMHREKQKSIQMPELSSNL